MVEGNKRQDSTVTENEAGGTQRLVEMKQLLMGGVEWLVIVEA